MYNLDLSNFINDEVNPANVPDELWAKWLLVSEGV